MKIKTIQSKGVKRLVVADAKINKLYDCSQTHPIELAVMTNYFEAGVYSVEDWRLTRYRPLSDTLEGSNAEFYIPKNEEERKYILSNLHTYREKEQNAGPKKGQLGIQWNTFDLSYWDGDNPSCRDKYGHEYSLTARFSFKGAMERLQEIREFWETWDNPDLEQARIVNPHRQISLTDIIMRQTLQDLEPENLAKSKARQKKKM